MRRSKPKASSHPGLLRSLKRAKTRESRPFFRGAYHRNLSRIDTGDKALILIDGKDVKKTGQDDAGEVLLFKPPFGPYPPELKETFPVGQSEMPETDEDMFRSGCRGLKVLVESNPNTEFTISGGEEFRHVIDDELAELKEKGRFSYV